jgi:chloride channel protein, CIC family
MMTRYVLALRFYMLIVLVGVAAGLGAIIFRELIGFFHNILFYGQFSVNYNAFQHAASSRWGVGIMLVPVIGAMCVAYLVQHFAPEARGRGVTEVIDAIYYKRGVVRPIVAVVKAVASSISIGSGGSVGREGPIIQIGAAFGSALGQWVKVADWQRIILVACGAGGGIAATFNTPFGGILFALEIMLPEWSARTIIPVSIATALATYTSYLYFGNAPFMPFTISAEGQFHLLGIMSYFLLSLLLGLFSTLFIRSIYVTEDLFDRLPGNYYLRHGLGMLLVGITMYLMMRFLGHYYIQGVGYATVFDVLSQTLISPGFLFFLALLKLVDTCITLGSGGSGGIFSPLLFIGATLGASFAGLCHYFFPGQIEMNVQLAALVGMAGMVGASTAAPLTAIIMTAELTNDFRIILPLMLMVALAYAVRRSLIKESVYTLKLTRRGHPVPDALSSHPQLMLK